MSKRYGCCGHRYGLALLVLALCCIFLSSCKKRYDLCLVNITDTDLYLLRGQRLRVVPAHKTTLFQNRLSPESLSPIDVFTKDGRVYKVISASDLGSAFVYDDKLYIFVLD